MRGCFLKYLFDLNLLRRARVKSRTSSPEVVCYKTVSYKNKNKHIGYLLLQLGISIITYTSTPTWLTVFSFHQNVEAASVGCCVVGPLLTLLISLNVSPNIFSVEHILIWHVAISLRTFSISQDLLLSFLNKTHGSVS